MENIDDEKILNEASLASSVGINELKGIYPKIAESKIPISRTNISAKVFYTWRHKKLIDLPEFAPKDWVYLDIFQNTWLEMIKQLRENGHSFDHILKIKKFVFRNVLDPILENPSSLIEIVNSNPSLSNAQKDASIKTIKELVQRGGIPEEFKIIKTDIGNEIINLLLRGKPSSLVVIDKEGELVVGFTSFDGKSDFEHLIPIYPNVQIPIKRIIEEFFGEPKNMEIIEALGLINEKEKEVIDAIRNKTFTEITITKIAGGGKMKEKVIVEVIKGTDVVDELKIKEIKRLLGLNEYGDVNIKYRNNKHVFFQNKIRL